MENEKEETGYFKKFCYKNGTQNVYRENIQDLIDAYKCSMDDISLFMTDQESDIPDKQHFKTYKSCLLKDVKQIKLIPDPKIEGFIFYF